MPINKKSWKDDQGNYRPASLTSVPGKVMEEIILSTIPQHRQNNCGTKPSHCDLQRQVLLDQADLLQWKSGPLRRRQGLENISYEEWLRELGFLSVEEAHGGPHCSLLFLKGGCGEMGAGLFYCVCSERTRGNGIKLRGGRFRLDITKKISLLCCPGRWWSHQPQRCLGSIWILLWVIWFSDLGVTVVVLGWQLDLLILKLSSNLDGSIILWKSRTESDWNQSRFAYLCSFFSATSTSAVYPLIKFSTQKLH